MFFCCLYKAYYSFVVDISLYLYAFLKHEAKPTFKASLNQWCQSCWPFVFIGQNIRAWHILWEWLKNSEEKDDEERESENDWRTAKKRMRRKGRVRMIEERRRKGWRGEGEWEWLKNSEEKDDEERQSENAWRTAMKRIKRRGRVRMIEEQWRKGWRGEGERKEEERKDEQKDDLRRLKERVRIWLRKDEGDNENDWERTRKKERMIKERLGREWEWWRKDEGGKERRF